MPDREPDVPIAPGDYMLALVWFQRKYGRKGDYLRCRFQVIAGPLKGQGFYANMGLDLSNRGTSVRWDIYAEYGRRGPAWSLDEDRDIIRVFKGAGFKGRVKRETRGQYINNDIEQITYRRMLSQQEEQVISDWDKEWSGRGSERGSDPGREEPPLHTDADKFPF